MTGPASEPTYRHGHLNGLAIFLNVVLEVLLQVLALTPVGLLVWLAVAWRWHPLPAAIVAALGLLYAYPLLLILLGALMVRLLPKPAPGRIRTARDDRRFMMLWPLLLLVSFRSLSRSLMLTPLGGQIWCRLTFRRYGRGSYVVSPDLVPEPWLVSLGENVLIGWHVTLAGHCTPRQGRLMLGEIRIEDGAMIGANAFIWPSVRIGRGAMVEAGAVVAPGTRIRDREVWGGVPAVKLREIPAEPADMAAAAP